ncbi:MAG: cell division protein FtsQ/DivIB [Saccharofermentanales bacterium]|jgi:cell division septal protein FtsQ
MAGIRQKSKKIENISYPPSRSNASRQQTRVAGKAPKSAKTLPANQAATVDYPSEKQRYPAGGATKTGLSLFAKLFAFFAVALALITLIVLLPAFRLDHVDITGNVDIATADILSVVDLESERHAFLDLGPGLLNYLTLRYGALETKLLQAFPELATVKACFSWPSGILIQVTERVETACIRNGLKYALVDSTGKVIRLVDSPPEYLPVIEEFNSLEPLTPGRQLNEDEMKLLEICTEITAQLILSDKAFPESKPLIGLTKSISPQANGFATLILQFDNEAIWRVKVSDSRSLPEAIRKLHEMTESRKLLDQGSGQLDLTADMIVFRRDNP